MYRKSVSRLASLIEDPVRRLRFLQTATYPPRRNRWLIQFLLILMAITLFVLHSGGSIARPTPPLLASIPIPEVPPIQAISAEPAAADVWTVETTADSETYSNGLRINNHFLVAAPPRSWLAFPVNGGEPAHRNDPAGVVFHSTESQQLPFESDENSELKRVGESLLDYVRRQRAYNFVIDRFGRVDRVVAEGEVANHAGHSVWADDNWFYVNLNHSFLGVAFEADSSQLSPGQVRSAAMLIEMLRHRYQIPASNFVTHAQVSVNPRNMRVGSHVDWASGFPFQAIGLPDNYVVALPAVWAFGFECDEHFTVQAAESLKAGIDLAGAVLNRNAAAERLPPDEYTKRLQQRYRKMLAEVKTESLDAVAAK
ncbi:MAG TPA: peptidoglycan recognition family protein [Bryobacteraceae bacterium]|nr:peptidoglycan recognition family protein [Bryobacteraceae bacterium]